MRYGLGMLAVCLTVPIAIAGTDDSVQLQYKLSKGDVLRYRTVKETRFDMPGDPVKLRSDRQISVTRVEVEDVGSDGVAAIRMIEESFRYEKIGSNGVFVYDSQQPRPPENEDEKIMAIAGAGVGLAIKARLASDGTVTDVNMEEVLASLSASKDPNIARMAKVLSTAAKNGPSSGNVGPMFPTLPPSSVRLGESWGPRAGQWQTPAGSVDSTAMSSLVGLEKRKDGQRAHVVIDERSEINPKGGTTPEPTLQVFQPDPSSSVRTVIFDVDRGWVISVESDLSFSAQITEVPPGANKAPGKSKTSVHTTTSLIEGGRMMSK